MVLNSLIGKCKVLLDTSFVSFCHWEGLHAQSHQILFHATYFSLLTQTALLLHYIIGCLFVVVE